MSIIDRINDYFYKKRRDKMAKEKIGAYPYYFEDTGRAFFLVFNINKNKKLHKMYKESSNGLKCILFYNSDDNVVTETRYLICKSSVPSKSYEDGSDLFIPVYFYLADNDKLMDLDEKGELIPMITELINEIKGLHVGVVFYAIDWYDVDYENKYEHRKLKRKILNI